DLPCGHEHRAATGDAADDIEPVLRRAFWVDLVAVRLEGADDDGGFFPLPDAQGRAAAALTDSCGQHLVEREVYLRRNCLVVDDFPVEVIPARRRDERSANGSADRFRVEAEQLRSVGKRFADRGGDDRGIR